MTEPLRILLVDDDAERSQALEQQLAASGIPVCCTVTNPLALLKQISDHQPDVVLVDMDSPGRDVLESLSLVSMHQPTPVLMFSREEDGDSIKRAVAAGVSTYLLGDVEPERVKAVIDVAIAQFDSFQSLRSQLDDTRSELTARLVVDKAKTKLMRKHGIGEDAAYRALRNTAMNEQCKVEEVAKRVVEER